MSLSSRWRGITLARGGNFDRLGSVHACVPPWWWVLGLCRLVARRRSCAPGNCGTGGASFDAARTGQRAFSAANNRLAMEIVSAGKGITLPLFMVVCRSPSGCRPSPGDSPRRHWRLAWINHRLRLEPIQPPLFRPRVGGVLSRVLVPAAGGTRAAEVQHLPGNFGRTTPVWWTSSRDAEFGVPGAKLPLSRATPGGNARRFRV